MAKHSPEEIKRLDDRMAEMDRLRSDPTMKLVRTKSGKFQYVPKEPELKSLSYKKASISTEAPITSLSYKDAAKSTPKPKYKPGSSSGPTSRYTPPRTSMPTTSSAELMRGFDKKIPSNTPADTASNRAKDNAVRNTSGTGNRGGSIPTPKRKEKPYSEDVKKAAKEAYYKALNDSRYERAGKDPDYFALDLFSMPTKNMKKGGKVGKVMGEFKSGSLKSSSGQKVANRKQAMAIAMSEAGKSMKTKKYAAGGKTDKRSFPSGDVFSNYDVGSDPFLKSRKGGTFTDKEMEDGLTKGEIMKKTEPKEPPKAKYAAGGNVKKMAGGGMFGTKAAAAGAARGYGAAKAAMDSMRGAGTGLGNIGNAAMGALRGMGGGNPTLAGMYGAAKGGMGLGRAAGTGGFNTSGLGRAAVNAGKGMFGMKKGGKVGESEKMVKEGMAFMKKKGAPKMGEAKGMKKMAKGGMSCMKRGGGVEKKGYGAVQKFAGGGAISIDGCAKTGHTRAAGHKK